MGTAGRAKPQSSGGWRPGPVVGERRRRGEAERGARVLPLCRCRPAGATAPARGAVARMAAEGGGGGGACSPTAATRGWLCGWRQAARGPRRDGAARGPPPPSAKPGLRAAPPSSGGGWGSVRQTPLPTESVVEWRGRRRPPRCPLWGPFAPAAPAAPPLARWPSHSMCRAHGSGGECGNWTPLPQVLRAVIKAPAGEGRGGGTRPRLWCVPSCWRRVGVVAHTALPRCVGRQLPRSFVGLFRAWCVWQEF